MPLDEMLLGRVFARGLGSVTCHVLPDAKVVLSASGRFGGNGPRVVHPFVLPGNVHVVVEGCGRIIFLERRVPSVVGSGRGRI